MPLPFGHSLMGYTLYETMPHKAKGLNWRMLMLFIVIANLPDIDFLPGFLGGNPNIYHHHYLSHSIGFAVFIGGMFAWFFSFKKGGNFLSYFLIFTSVCYSHIIMDLVTADTGEPFGVPMFWPLTKTYYYSPFSIFMSLHKIGLNKEFIQSLFVLHNLWVALWEIVIFMPILTIITVVKMCRKSQKKRDRVGNLKSDIVSTT